MMETVCGDALFGQPDLARRFEQAVRAVDVGVDEGVRAVDGAVDVGFGGEMDQRVDGLGAQQVADERGIADVAISRSPAALPGVNRWPGAPITMPARRR